MKSFCTTYSRNQDFLTWCHAIFRACAFLYIPKTVFLCRQKKQTNKQTKKELKNNRNKRKDKAKVYKMESCMALVVSVFGMTQN